MVTPAMIAERTFLPTPDGLSLMESIRGELPEDPDAPTGLVLLVTEFPGLYSTFLGKLMCGSSSKAAALATGQWPSTIANWLQQGANDVAEGFDSYCARFIMDCQRAAASAISNAEERVFAKDPDKWLGKGPAKDFHQGRYWVDKTQPLVEGDDPLDPTPAPAIEDQQAEEDQAGQALDSAIKVLEDMQILQKPEFVQQAKEQFKID